MNRRQYVTTLGAVGVAALCGCNGVEVSDDAEVTGELVVEEDVVGSGEYTFETEAGETLSVHVENEAQQQSTVTITGPEEQLRSLEIAADEREITLTAQSTGTHTIAVQQQRTDEEVSIEVGVQ